ncbi:proline--tRNA ligase [Candidatus Woesearchaeota archaeon]|nr:proline--tRNA ligase [Candidatus Woesearchaeota archaeon]
MSNSKKSPQADEKGITVKKTDDMPEWYGQVVMKSELADYSPVRGTMIIRPYGYAIWQKIQDYFNARLKELKVENAYFPMFIPESFFAKEAEHAEGFSPEVAWVTNKDEDSGERLALRPTSETIMYDSYAKWIRSHRDLPLRINQWCNIVRWEVKDVKLFLRSREFLWQEGHCVYTTEEECDKEALMMLDEYVRLCKDLLAIPVIPGKKSEKEKFAGAKWTSTIEAYMPDGKFLQSGTSHNLGQGFAKAFGITYKGEDEQNHLPWQSSWGFSTRLIGALIMQHGDDKGLVLPPSIAPIQIAIVPIVFKKDTAPIDEAHKVAKELESYEVKVDDREEYSAGWKFNQYEMKGVPLRIEIGPKDIEKGQVVIARRDTGEKYFVKRGDLKDKVEELLQDIQENLYSKAQSNIDENIVEPKDWNEFVKAAEARKVIIAPFCGKEDCEDIIKEETKGANSRCFPLEQQSKDLPEDCTCIQCGKPAIGYAYFGKCY